MTNVLLTGSLESFIQLLGALFIFAVVLAATYLTTRWMGGMQRGRQNNKNLHVIETISVGNNKMISIVEVGSVDRKSTRLNSSHVSESRMPSSA